MGQIEVFQLHGTDVIGVGHLNLYLHFLHDRPAVFIINNLPGNRVPLVLLHGFNFRPVPGFRFHGLRQDILLFKEHFQIVLYIVKGKYPFMEG